MLVHGAAGPIVILTAAQENRLESEPVAAHRELNAQPWRNRAIAHQKSKMSASLRIVFSFTMFTFRIELTRSWYHDCRSLNLKSQNVAGLSGVSGPRVTVTAMTAKLVPELECATARHQSATRA